MTVNLLLVFWRRINLDQIRVPVSVLYKTNSHLVVSSNHRSHLLSFQPRASSAVAALPPRPGSKRRESSRASYLQTSGISSGAGLAHGAPYRYDGGRLREVMTVYSQQIESSLRSVSTSSEKAGPSASEIARLNAEKKLFGNQRERIVAEMQRYAATKDPRLR